MAVDITADFVKRLKENGATALAAGVRGDSGWEPFSMAAGKAVKYAWFYQKVRNKGEWDLKNNVYAAYDKVIVSGLEYRKDMPGNFHFGYVGAAAGFMETILLRGAGKAQERAGTSKPEFHCTYGDDPEDHEFIRLGFQLYKNVGLKVTSSNLLHVLRAFSVITCP